MKKLFLLISVLFLAVMANATAPSTDFAAPGYYCSADDAVLSGTVSSSNFYLYSASTPHYIVWSDAYPYDASLASWNIVATRACYISVGLDLGPAISSNKHIFEVKILDESGNPVGTMAEDPADPEGSTEKNKEADQIKTFEGSILIPAAGEYTVELRNIRGYGKGSIKNIILTCVGEIPSTDFASACVLTAAKATVGTGIEVNTHYGEENPYLRYTGSTPTSSKAEWVIQATRACNVNVKVNLVDNEWNKSVDGNYKNGGHIFGVELWDLNDERRDTVAEEAYEKGSSKDGQYTYPTVDLGSIRIPEAGIYYIKLLNCRSWSKCGVGSVTLTYEGGAVVDIPGAISINDATHNGTRADGVISYADPTTGWAKWNVKVETEGFYHVNITIKNQYGHNFTAQFYEADGVTPAGNASEGSTKYSSNNTEGHTINLGGVYLKPGNYVLEVTNSTSGSDAKIMGLSTAYVGGAMQNLPCTTDNSEAWFSSGGTRADGMISFSSYTDQWVKWNISNPTTLTHSYDVSLNIYSPSEYGHRFSVAFYEDENEEPVCTLTESSWNKSYGTPLAIPMGIVNLDPSKAYIAKVTNAENGAQPKIISLTFTQAGGDAVNLPGTLSVDDAWFSANGTRADGKISFPGATINEGWVKWNVAFASAANYNVTVNINNVYGHNYTVGLYENESALTPIVSVGEGGTEYGAGTPYAIDLGAMTVPAGSYILKVTNATENSDAKLISVNFSYLGGGTINIPNASFPFADAILSARAYIDGTGLHFTDNEHYGHMAEEYARWNIHAEAGVYNFTAHGCSPDNYSNIKFRILRGEEELYSYAPQYSYKNADKAITSPNWFLDGDYTLEVSNPVNHSHGYLLSLSAAAASGTFITIDENAENIDVLVDNDGQSRTPIVKRSFKAGMYNTICVPFNVSSNSELEGIFGAGYELLELESGSLEGDVLFLNFAVPASNIAYGRPYLIKPTKDVLNPVFEAHTISKSVSHLSQPESGVSVVHFIGKLCKDVIPASENNLFLTANDRLVFPLSDKEIKGTRAYFEVNPSAVGGAPIRRARIVTPNDMPTEINLVDSEKNGTIKTIENGQLFIIRDGVRYNVMGVKVQ